MKVSSSSGLFLTGLLTACTASDIAPNMNLITKLRKTCGTVAYALCFVTATMLLTTSVTPLTSQNDVDVLKDFLRQIGDPKRFLTGNWTGDDPCGSSWLGVYCNQTQHVHELRLLNLNLTGFLAPELGNLTSLNILDVMWNDISGSIPKELGNLKNLTLLLLNGNKFSGSLPESLGYLPNLVRLQVDENNLSGSIPTSFQYLSKTRHFHMNNNSFSGSIPPELGQLPSLIHLLLDNNKLSGPLPTELSNISSLITLQLDNNQFTGSIPPSYYTFPKLAKLSLRNCNLSGIIQNLTSLTSLKYIDLSQNHFNGELPSGELPQDLNTILLSYNQLNGGLTGNIAEMANLQYLGLKHNNFGGAVPSNLGAGVIYNKSSSKLIIDLRDNIFERNDYTDYASNVTFWLNGNPACNSSSVLKECEISNVAADIRNVTYQDPAIPLPIGCGADTCDSSLNQELVYGILKDLQTCFCASPITVGYRLKSPGFSYFPPFEDDLASYLSSRLSVLQQQINISDFFFDGSRMRMSIKLFPSYSLHKFNDSEVERLYNVLTTWVIPDNPVFGPAELLFVTLLFPYNQILPTSESGSVSNKTLAGVVIGAVIFTAAVVAGVMFLVLRRKGYKFSKKKVGKRDPRIEKIKASGVTDFKFEEMALATKNFDKSMEVGRGGYGKVYKGFLPGGKVVAIKRAQEGSLQGANEFYTEIEMLSRVHHRHLVSLVGYCDHEEEQMLVYEFISNGTLRDALSARRPLDFHKRVQIALGSARGILYLHTEANPPIFHRDIKASNILLDEKDRAKVADFGLSKLVPVADDEGAAFGYVSTVVKGTPGYLDPEYFMTHKLTDRSDVYSFGVVLLELITGMQPITDGKNLVREVQMANEAGVMASLIDSQMGSYSPEAIQPLVRLAISCCQEKTDARPSMADVVRGLEDIQRLDNDVLNMDRQKHNTFFSKDPYSSLDKDGSEPLNGIVQNMLPR